jgi:hypothetical protein
MASKVKYVAALAVLGVGLYYTKTKPINCALIIAGSVATYMVCDYYLSEPKEEEKEKQDCSCEYNPDHGAGSSKKVENFEDAGDSHPTESTEEDTDATEEDTEDHTSTATHPSKPSTTSSKGKATHPSKLATTSSKSKTTGAQATTSTAAKSGTTKSATRNKNQPPVPDFSKLLAPPGAIESLDGSGSRFNIVNGKAVMVNPTHWVDIKAPPVPPVSKAIPNSTGYDSFGQRDSGDLGYSQYAVSDQINPGDRPKRPRAVYGEVFVDPEYWHPPCLRPPVCVTSTGCPVQPVFAQGLPVDLLEWDASRKITPPDTINVDYVKNVLDTGALKKPVPSQATRT